MFPRFGPTARQAYFRHPGRPAVRVRRGSLALGQECYRQRWRPLTAVLLPRSGPAVRPVEPVADRQGYARSYQTDRAWQQCPWRGRWSRGQSPDAQDDQCQAQDHLHAVWVHVDLPRWLTATEAARWLPNVERQRRGGGYGGGARCCMTWRHQEYGYTLPGECTVNERLCLLDFETRDSWLATKGPSPVPPL